MKIVVCIKQVPATDAKLTIRTDGLSIDPANLTYVLNPYDEFAVEEALRIKEKLGQGDVMILSLGTDRAQESIRSCLAMGADQAILIRDDLFEGCDSLGTARILAACLKTLTFDILFFGKQAVDDDMGAVGIEVAELLNLPHVSVISKLEVDLPNHKAIAHRRIEGGMEIVETSLPAVFTAHRELNVPRYASLPGIMKAKTKPLQKLGNDTLNVDPAHVGSSGSKIRMKKMDLPPKRAPGRILEGETSQKVSDLVRILREEIKIL